jgi:hypothetical protein
MVSAFQCFANDPRWVGWLNEERGPEGKLTKVPYGLGDKPAKADKPETWLTYEEATALYRRIVNGKGGGVGIELGDLGADQYLVGVDLDSCIDESGCLALWAEKILVELDTYAETSPSKRGVKAFFRCASEDIRPLLEALGVTDPNQAGIKRSVGGDGRDHGPGVEVYTARRFFAVTGKLMPGKPDRINMIDWPQLERITRLIPPARSTNGSASGGRDSSRSAIAFRKAAELRRAGLDYEQMVDALALDPETADWVREKGMAQNQRELRRIWDRAGQKDAAPQEISDDELALRFSERHVQDLRYVALWGKWLLWCGSHWQKEQTLKAFDLSRSLCRAVGAQSLKNAASIASAAKVAAVERLARSDRRHAITHDQLNADDWLINQRPKI